MSKQQTENPDNWLNEHGDMLYRYALIRVQSEQVAEDLVQETLLAGLKSVESFSGKSTVRTWLTGILKHKIIDHFRKKHQQTISLNDESEDQELLNTLFTHNGSWATELKSWQSPEQDFENQQFWQAFQFCLSRLPQNMADLFLMRTMEGMSTDDCCKVFGFTTTNQLWTTISRARMRLRTCLGHQWFEKF